MNSAAPLLIGDQPLPHSADTERAVCSCLLQDEGAYDIVMSLRDDDFYIPTFRRLIMTARKIGHERVTDMALLMESLDCADELEVVGGLDQLRAIFNAVPSAANVEQYVASVRNAGRLRRLISTCSELAGDAFGTAPDDTDTLMDRAERSIMQLSSQGNTRDEVQHISALIPEAIEHLDGLASRDPRYIGIPTGFRELDGIITGLKPGEVVVVAARPSIGKTAFATTIIKRAGFFGLPALMEVMEMRDVRIAQRMICSDCAINTREMFHLKQNIASYGAEAVDAIRQLSSLPIYLDDTSRDWPGIRRRIRKAVKEHDIRLVAVDYLQLMRSGERHHSREQEVAYMSASVKELAMELGIPIIVLAQLNRIAEREKPQISHLRESGAIEQDADQVWLLARAREVEDDKVAEHVAQGKPIPASCIVAKNREGPTGIAHLSFWPQFARFDDQLKAIDDEDVPIV